MYVIWSSQRDQDIDVEQVGWHHDSSSALLTISLVSLGASSGTSKAGNSSVFRWGGTSPREASSEMTDPSERRSVSAMALAAASTLSSMSRVVLMPTTIHHRITTSRNLQPAGPVRDRSAAGSL